MKISNREKNIILVVLSLAILFCAYWFGFRNISSSNDSLDKEISSLQSKLNNLRIMEAEAGQYQEDTITFKEKSAVELAKYDTGYSQVHSIMFVKEIENMVNAWVGQVGISDAALIYDFGQTGSTNPYPETGFEEYSSDYEGYQTTLTLSYQTTYDDFKNMIEFINTYKHKCTIDTISMTYNSTSNIVSGSIVVSQYAIKGEDREFVEETFENYLYGTTNIFYSDIFHSGDGDSAIADRILTDYDYYLSMNYQTDNESISIGAKADVTGQNALTVVGNTDQDCMIRFFQLENDYYVQYSIGKEEYPATNFDAGVYFIPGDSLDLLIMSSEREDKTDLLTAHATIINETDLVLNIRVVGDDSGNPRFVVDKSEGDVVVYR